MVIEQENTPIPNPAAQESPDNPQDTLSRLASNGASHTQTSNKSLDMMTLAGLTQWCARAIRNIGRENFETLIQVSLMTGRLSDDTGRILLALVPLFEGTSDDVVSAKEVVALMLQLDGLLGVDAKSDSRMLPFLLMEDMDPFSGAVSRAAPAKETPKPGAPKKSATG